MKFWRHSLHCHVIAPVVALGLRAATNNLDPALWLYVPDCQASLDYFVELDDLELMAVAQQCRLVWGDFPPGAPLKRVGRPS